MVPSRNEFWMCKRLTILVLALMIDKANYDSGNGRVNTN